jgi:SAM-dependent methyltransferase
MLRRIDTSRPAALSDVAVPGRDSREFLALLKGRVPIAAAVLDLGCGPRDQESPITGMGWRYVGVDYSGDAADLLADAHALPFQDQSFDVVFSFAVLEHLHTPARALTEVARILKPGGLYVGSVSQGEPFHGSYFHFTPWGLIAALSHSRKLDLIRVWPSEDTLRSLSTMGRYPRVIRALINVVHRFHETAPWLAPRRISFAMKDKEIDQLYRAGSLCFLAKRCVKP